MDPNNLYIFALNWEEVFKRWQLYRITFSSDKLGNLNKTSSMMGKSKLEKNLMTYIPKNYVEVAPRGDLLKNSNCKKLWFPSIEIANKVLDG